MLALYKVLSWTVTTKDSTNITRRDDIRRNIVTPYHDDGATCTFSKTHTTTSTSRGRGGLSGNCLDARQKCDIQESLPL
jgi:hypothetical protein